MNLIGSLERAGEIWAKDGVETFYTTNIKNGQLLEEAFKIAEPDFTFDYMASACYGFIKQYDVRRYKKGRRGVITVEI